MSATKIGLSAHSSAAAADFRKLVGTGFDQFTRQAPVKALLALAKFAEPVNIAVLQFADESRPLFQQRAKLARALWRAPGRLKGRT